MTAPNILFVMCDQLRWDYLGCTGHPTIRTPHIDRLAARGIRFDRAYVQSPICGPSRMSTYTGRYMRSHGSTWNGAPLSVGEMNIGHHLNPLGMRTALSGKTHVAPDLAGMRRLGIDPGSEVGRKLAQGGFEAWDRLDGLHPPESNRAPSHYNAYLTAQGYPGDHPWHYWANGAADDDGGFLNGWLMEHSDRPARAREEDTETPYSGRRAREFIEAAGEDNWCLHLSFIKPHWPYIAPAPYHDMYGPEDVIRQVGGPEAGNDTHPVLAAFRGHRASSVWHREGVRERVIPAYMGLITQIDDEMGRMMDWLEETGRAGNTVIVFTSDHGDYLGDHGLGEKELFHDCSARIPLIVYDPRPQADATRGSVSDALVESIDLLPTFVEMAGGTPEWPRLEGLSLMPLIRGDGGDWPRDAVFSEYDYASRLARETLGTGTRDSRLTMVFDGRWKMVHAEGMRPMLWDLETDPEELHEIGADPAHAAVLARLRDRMLSWASDGHARVTRTDAEIEAMQGREMYNGILIGFWDEADLEDARAKGHSGS